VLDNTARPKILPPLIRYQPSKDNTKKHGQASPGIRTGDLSVQAA
jgi:hypothetical protein